MISDFTDLGVLPPTQGAVPYVCRRDEVEQRFVVDMGETPWRRVFFDGWDLLQQSVAKVCLAARWWLWGSLVSAREQPMFGENGTVDAALLVPAFAIEPADLGLLQATRQSSEQLHRVDIHDIVYESPPGSPGFDVAQLTLRKLRDRASCTFVDDVTKEKVDAGFVEVVPTEVRV